MRFLFLFSLLINVVFLLWEINSGALNSQADKTKASPHAEKQILLVSELQSKENKIVKPPKTEEKVKTEIVLSQNTQEDLLPKEPVENKAIQVESNLATDSPELGEEEGRSILDVVDQAIANIGLFNSDDEEEKNEDEVVALKKSYCYQIGPFENENTLLDWQQQNKIDIAAMTRVNIDRRTNTRYFVYYPAEKTYKQSKKNVRLFKSKGVKDFLLIRTGKLKGSIALGVFSKKKGALYIKAKLAKKGLKIIIKERYKTISELYVKIKTTDESFKANVVISDKQQLSDCVIETGLVSN